LQGSPQAPLYKMVEWTRKGIGKEVARIPVSPEELLAIYDRMSRPNSSATDPERDESLMENSDATLLVGRRPNGTYIIT